MDNSYEKHTYDNINLPILFHINHNKSKSFNFIHWHENIEILFFEDGIGEVLVGENIVNSKKGDVIIVNSEELHSIKALTDEVMYSCLIIDKKTCEQFGFYIDEQYVNTIVNDKRLYKCLDVIKKEFFEKNKYYAPAIMSAVIKILTILYRYYSSEESYSSQSKNIIMVKAGIKYIKKHFKEQLTVEDIADYAGYSKYYFCRCFKEITGYTVNSYINTIRVDHAHNLLSKQGMSVSEVSEECGFSDISYFTKIFKKYASVLPSKVKAQQSDHSKTD